MNIWNLWAISYRNARALGAALSMLIAILVMSSLRCNPVVEKANIHGLVVTIEAEGLHPFGDGEAQSRVLVATSDSTRVRLFLPPPVPKVDDVIPLVVERYKKGDSIYSVDLLKWRAEGPGPH